MFPYLLPLASPSLPPSLSHPSRWSKSTELISVVTWAGQDGTNDPTQAVSNPRRAGLALLTSALRPRPGLSCRTWLGYRLPFCPHSQRDPAKLHKCLQQSNWQIVISRFCKHPFKVHNSIKLSTQQRSPSEFKKCSSLITIASRWDIVLVCKIRKSQADALNGFKLTIQGIKVLVPEPIRID